MDCFMVIKARKLLCFIIAFIASKWFFLTMFWSNMRLKSISFFGLVFTISTIIVPPFMFHSYVRLKGAVLIVLKSQRSQPTLTLSCLLLLWSSSMLSSSNCWHLYLVAISSFFRFYFNISTNCSHFGWMICIRSPRSSEEPISVPKRKVMRKQPYLESIFQFV